MTDTQSWTVAMSTLEAGVWSLRLEGASQAPKLEASHAHRTIPDVTVTEEDGAILVRVDLPPAVLSDGLQSVHLMEKKSGVVLASLHVAAGRTVSQDLATELALLRDEVDLLKRVFRRHFAD
ncbi:hypothetical protein [Palleronia abyssalis]|uniref:Uncharacterized protein n=1 Tax=Palleronia abyssalis TaxID=1501240 RepID=A0A2R8BSD6_9RHOB|nr:hypothetical protein [Palleronia abyssalis]SPJ23060.1 hypothetical protein PAA8504_00865 [Palleronia abyssalis]